MKIMSFNCRGLAGPLKRPALRRVIDLEHPDVLLLQETLGEMGAVKARLEGMLPGWTFECLDVRGRSGGLATGWNTRSIRIENVWGMESVIGCSLSSLDIGEELTLLNIYGPYQDRIPFWENIFKNDCFKRGPVIIGGDLNFSLGPSEIWGPQARVDTLTDFFTHKLMDMNLIDVEPISIKPTWRNMRSGESRVAKRLDRFLVADSLVDRQFFLRQWIGSGGQSDHFPIFMELRKGPALPASPLKFNKTWLKDESFIKLIKENWVPFDMHAPLSAAFQFSENIKKLKSIIKEWSFTKRQKEEAELKQLEIELSHIYDSDGGGLGTLEDKEDLVRKEGRRNILLQEKEETWRLKSRAVWLECGDENTKFFQAYAKGRKCANTIWKLEDPDGRVENSFEGMARIGVSHFQNLFKANTQATIEEVVRLAQMFPGFVNEEDNQKLNAEVSEEELKETLSSFQKDRSPGPDGWTIEFFQELYEILGNDILRVVEDSRQSGRIPASINSTFIALIPKTDNPSSLDDFRPISLCNCIYKVISKIIARRIKGILSTNISIEQFGFLKGRQIHEAIGVAQEGLHSMKTSKIKGAVIKIDLSKAYDKVNWLFIRLLLTHLGFNINFIRWVMSCITTVSFAVLINGSASPFFHSGRGLRQGCPLSPLLFLLVAEGLSRAIAEASRNGSFKGIKISPSFHLTHLLFVDDVLIFCSGSRRDAESLNSILDLFSKATGMEYNTRKSTISSSLLSDGEIARLKSFFPFETKSIEDGLKYLGFNLKPNNYKKSDWLWLLEKLDKKLKVWSHKWLSRAGRLVLVKSVLEAIPVYWMSLSWIPKGVIEAYRRLCFKFLWSGKKDSQVTPWVKWEILARPKDRGGWGLKNIFLFSKALAAKVGWRLLSSSSLWQKVVVEKYIAPDSLEAWIRKLDKNSKGISVVWKAVLKSFSIIGNNLAWKIGNGEKVRIGVDPWQGSSSHHLLSPRALEALEGRGIFMISQLADEQSTTLWAQGWKTARSLGLEDGIAPDLDRLISALRNSHIRLRDREDALIWDKDPGGFYTPKAGYLSISQETSEQRWWWKKLWKLKCPPKSKIFMWCAFENKVPTWDILKKRNLSGPGWCCLCKNEEESSYHLFMQCKYMTDVWGECSKLLGILFRWEGSSLEEAWKSWISYPAYHETCSLPILVIWGIWLARNSSIFRDKEISPEVTAVKSISIFTAFRQKPRSVKTKNLSIIEIDKTRPWGFFDGASQNNRCGGGAILYLSEDHHFRIAIGLGEGSNNFAEILSLKALLAFALEQNVKDITIYGDSMNVINWTKGTQRCINLNLENLLEDVLLLKSSFETCTCHHIYRTQNQAADQESKRGLLLDNGQWKITEFHGAQSSAIYHEPLIR